MITVTTPNGRTGSLVLRQLLDQTEQLRVISHTPDKLPQAVRDRCEVIAGSLDDAETLKRGFDGAESVFWCIPQSREGNRWSDAHEYHHRFAKAAASALSGSSTRVVAISAGRHGYDDQAIVAAFSAVEDTINTAGVPVRHLRCAYFMENLLDALPMLVSPGAVFYNGPGDTPLPMVCVADAAAKAVQILMDRSWHDQGHIAVHGPAHLTFDDIAAVLSESLEKPIRYIQVPDDVLMDNFKRVGFPDGFARALARLLTKEALEAYNIEPRTRETTTATTLREWASSTLLPAYRAFQGQRTG